MTKPFRILVLDDERLSRITTAQQLRKLGFHAKAIDNPFAALSLLDEELWDGVLADLRMPGMTGIEFLKKALKKHPHLSVIIMTAFGTIETAVEAMKIGAEDYLVKPFKIEELEIRLVRIQNLARKKAELTSLQDKFRKDEWPHGLIGRAPCIKKIIERISIFANHDAPILITGETGTGKEVVSRALHQASSRKDAPFIPIACGTIPGELAESELFGHEKGSFTGAVSRRIGSFERADGGTLLLDDIDDLPLSIQVKLLRILQEGTLTRVGGTEELRVDVRVIATSKVDLAKAVEEGKFRDDLFYRLRGLEIHLPPLRLRGEDVLLLANHFLRLIALRENKDKPLPIISTSLANALRGYHWPGNARELRRAMESAFILSQGKEIRPEHLPLFLSNRCCLQEAKNTSYFVLKLGNAKALSFHELMDDFEEQVLQWALTKAQGQQKKAAEILKIPRTTLQSRLTRVRQKNEAH
jgi:DNA-binding NtrC family response regulator